MSLERFKFMAGVAMVDGKLDPAETPVLLKAAAELGVPADQAKAVLRALENGQSASMKVPKEPGERAKLFRQLVDLVAADGEIDKNELAFFQKIAPKFHLEELEVEDLLHAASRAAREKGRRRASERLKAEAAAGESAVRLETPVKPQVELEPEEE